VYLLDTNIVGEVLRRQQENTLTSIAPKVSDLSSKMWTDVDYELNLSGNRKKKQRKLRR
jgi:predicted nucleic acid-binding protein